VIDLQVAFPPAKENLYVPPELISEGNLLGGEIVEIGGDPIISKLRFRKWRGTRGQRCDG